MGPPLSRATDRRSPEAGFSLVEILVAMLVLGFAMLAVVPLFVQSARATASAGEIGNLTAVVSQRMEALRDTEFTTLTAGGSLAANETGFFDASDPDYLVRWTVTDDASPPTRKTIRVWGEAARAPSGRQKELLLVAVAAE